MPRKTPTKNATPSKRRSKVPDNLPDKVPQPHGGAIYRGGVPGHTGGGGRPRSDVKALASAKLPHHVETLDTIANGTTYVKRVEKCPKCGHEENASALAIPIDVKPGERVRAVEALAKLADAKELVIASDRAAAFFDCVHRAMVELVGESNADAVKARAVTLMDGAA